MARSRRRPPRNIVEQTRRDLERERRAQQQANRQAREYFRKFRRGSGRYLEERAKGLSKTLRGQRLALFRTKSPAKRRRGESRVRQSERQFAAARERAALATERRDIGRRLVAEARRRGVRDRRRLREISSFGDWFGELSPADRERASQDLDEHDMQRIIELRRLYPKGLPGNVDAGFNNHRLAFYWFFRTGGRTI